MREFSGRFVKSHAQEKKDGGRREALMRTDRQKIISFPMPLTGWMPPAILSEPANFPRNRCRENGGNISPFLAVLICLQPLERHANMGVHPTEIRMPAFISYSFENRPEFDNIVDALGHVGVEYWNPDEVQAGSSLRDQLRDAVKRCAVCIFIATRKAVESNWCGAELGAFWGAGKPIIVYLAEPSLEEEELPRIVQGDVWERRMTRIAARAKQLLETVPAPGVDQGSAPPPLVGNMTIEQLQKLIAGSVSLAAAGADKTEGQSQVFDQVGDAVRGAAGKVLEGIRATENIGNLASPDWHRQILWVDDRPENNVHERQAFESMGFGFSLALSTTEALRMLATSRFAAIISDMGRKEGAKEGYVLLEKVRRTDQQTPFYIYAGSESWRHQREAEERGAQGTTNQAGKLVDMVLRGLSQRE